MSRIEETLIKIPNKTETSLSPVSRSVDGDYLRLVPILTNTIHYYLLEESPSTPVRTFYVQFICRDNSFEGG